MTTLILGMVHTLGKFFQTLKITLVRELLLEKKRNLHFFVNLCEEISIFCFQILRLFSLQCCFIFAHTEKKKRRERKKRGCGLLRCLGIDINQATHDPVYFELMHAQQVVS